MSHNGQCCDDEQIGVDGAVFVFSCLCYDILMFHWDVLDLGILDIEIYKCITKQIDTDRVIISRAQLFHIAEHHPEAYTEALIELKSTIRKPDYIFRDDRHKDTGLVVKRLLSGEESLYIVLRICTDSQSGTLANSVISGWKISAKRLENYVRNKTILYKKS